MRYIKILAVFLVLGVLAVGGALLTAAAYLDQEIVRAELEAYLERVSGREVTISGTPEFAYFPWLGMRLGPIAVSNPPGFSDQSFATAASLSAHISLTALLDRRLELDEVSLHGFFLNLQRNAEGYGNWEQLITGSYSAQPLASTDSFAFKEVVIRRVRLRNASAALRDFRSGKGTAVSGVNLIAGPITSRGDSPFELSFRFGYGTVRAQRPQVSVDLRMAGFFKPEAGTGALVFRNVATRAELMATIFSVDVPLHLVALFDLNPRTEQVRIPELNLTLPGGEISGRFRIHDLRPVPQISGRLAMRLPRAQELFKTFGIGQGGFSAVRTLSLSSAIDTVDQKLSFYNLALSLDEQRLRGLVEITKSGIPGVKVDLRGEVLDLRPYLGGGQGSSKRTTSADVFPIGFLDAVALNARLQLDRAVLAENFPVQLDTQLTVADGIGSLLVSATGAERELRCDALVYRHDEPLGPELIMSAALTTRGIPLAALGLSGLPVQGTIEARGGWWSSGGTADALWRNQHVWIDARVHQSDVVPNQELEQAAITPARLSLRTFPGETGYRYSALVSMLRASPLEAIAVSLNGQTEITALFTEPLEGHLQASYLGAVGGNPLVMDLSAQAQIDPDLQQASLRELRATLPNLTVVGRLSARGQTMEDLAYDGNLRIANSASRGPTNATKRETAIPTFTAKVKVSGGSDHLSIRQIEGRLEGMPIRGNVSVAKFQAPRVNFDLETGNLELDSYLQLMRKQTTSQAQPPLSESLERLDLSGKLAVQRVEAMGVALDDLRLGINAQRGRIEVNAERGLFYEGRLKGALVFDARDLRSTVDLSIRGLDTAEIVAAVTGHRHFGGTMDLSTHLTTIGLDATHSLHSLNGRTEVKVTNGSFSYHDDPKNSRGKPKYRIDFERASATWIAENGRFTNRDFMLRGPSLSARGQGSIDTVTDRVDYRLEATKFGTLAVPITISGSLAELEVDVPKSRIVGKTLTNILKLPFHALKLALD